MQTTGCERYALIKAVVLVTLEDQAGDTLKIRHLLVQCSCPLSNNGYLVPEVLVFQLKVFFNLAAWADLDRTTVSILQCFTSNDVFLINKGSFDL